MSDRARDHSLDDPELEYDEEAARPHVTAIARGWYDFKKAHGAINKSIKAKLDAK